MTLKKKSNQRTFSHCWKKIKKNLIWQKKLAEQNRKTLGNDFEEEAEWTKIFPLFRFYDLRDGGGRLKKWPEVKVTIPVDIFDQRLLCCFVPLTQNWPKSQVSSVNRIISRKMLQLLKVFVWGILQVKHHEVIFYIKFSALFSIKTSQVTRLSFLLHICCKKSVWKLLVIRERVLDGWSINRIFGEDKR